MKVWIVLCQYFDDTSVEVVCLNEEKANEEMQKAVNRKEMYHYYMIEDYEVVQ